MRSCCQSFVCCSHHARQTGRSYLRLGSRRCQGKYSFGVGATPSNGEGEPGVFKNKDSNLLCDLAFAFACVYPQNHVRQIFLSEDCCAGRTCRRRSVHRAVGASGLCVHIHNLWNSRPHAFAHSATLGTQTCPLFNLCAYIG
jgi:hypothetical protein